jgi:hypothetical protein
MTPDMVLSFLTAGELADTRLSERARGEAAAVLLGLVGLVE